MIKISGVSERDIDLMLLEEFISSSDFRYFIISKCNLTHKNLSFLEAHKSVTDTTGESDLEVIFKDESNNKHILLIENKVNANFQEKQLERYKERGNNYIRVGKALFFTTILISPKIFHRNELKGFDHRINYEDILKYFENNNKLGDRKKYKIILIKSAIEKGTTGYQMEADASVSRFWKDYWRLSLEEAKEFYMDEPGYKPASSSFIYFRSIQLPKNIDLVHKVIHGYFDLQFRNMGNKIHEMRGKYTVTLDHNMEIVKAAKSASIRVKVPKLSMSVSLESQKEKVIECLKIGKHLLKWYKENG